MSLEGKTNIPLEPPVRVDAAICSGCGACVSACPVDVLALDATSRKAIVTYPDDCCVCFLCQEDCPTGAVKVAHDSGNQRLISIYDQLDIAFPDWLA